MKQHNLFMHEARTLRSMKISHNLVALYRTVVGYARKLYDGLAWPTALQFAHHYFIALLIPTPFLLCP